MAEPTIRRIRPLEGKALREVRLAALRDAPDAFASTFESESGRVEEAWDTWAAAASEGNDACVFVADEDGRMVGMAGAFRRERAPRTLHLISMWVHPEKRGAGIGTALTRAVVLWARGADADALTLWVVDGNDTAKRLYERAGFTGTGRRQPMPEKSHLTESLMSIDLDGAFRLPPGYLELVPMSGPDFDAFAAHRLATTAAGLVAKDGLEPAEAMRRSSVTLATLLPQGESTRGQHLARLHVGDDDRPAGWIWFSADGDSCTLIDLFVFEARRGQGVGSAALDELEEWARRNRLPEVRIDGRDAIGFFEKHGYRGDPPAKPLGDT